MIFKFFKTYVVETPFNDLPSFSRNTFSTNAESADAVALLPLIGLDADLQEKAKVLPAPIGLCYKTAQLARYEIYNTAAIRSSAPNIVDLPSGYSPRGFRVSSAKELPFAVDSTVTEGKLVMKVQGRVDTLTATELLNSFQEASPQTDSIELDVEKMHSISSAGLRVLLIMRKSVKDQSRFKILHAQPEVEKILKMTGFDMLLL